MSGGFGLPVLDIAGMLGKVGKNYQDSYQDAYRQSALGKLGEQIQGGDYAGAARTAFNAGDPSVGLNLLTLGQKQEQQKAATAGMAGVSSMYGSGGFDAGGPVGAPGAPRQAPASGVPSFVDQSGPQGDYLTGLFKRESNNNPLAQAGTSSAKGLGQFTTGTWNGVARKYPDLALTPVGPGTDGRTDPDQMIRATKALTAENEGVLGRVGLPVTDASRYALHFLGPSGGVRLVGGALNNPDAPAASYASPDAVAANRPIFFNRDGSPKTAGQVMGDFARSFGGGGRGAPQAPQQVASADPSFMPTAPGPLTRSPLQAPVSGLNPDAQQAPAGGPPQTLVPQSMAGMGIPGTVMDRGNPVAQAPAPQVPTTFGPGPQVSAGPTASLPLAPGAGGGAVPTRALPPSSSPGALNVPQAPPAPTLPDAGAAPPARIMTMPGQDGAGPSPEVRAQVSAQAPQHLAQAGIPPQVAAPIGQMAPGSQQRIGALMRVAMLPGLSEGQAGVVKTLLSNELEQTKLPDDVKQYMFARSQGFAGSLVDFKNEIRKPLTPTTVAPGAAVIFPGERTPAYIAPRADDTKLTNVPAGATVFDPVTRQPVYTAPAPDKADEGAKITGAIAARRAAAPGLGLQEGTPAWRSYVASNKIGADRDMSPTEKKSIETADNAVLSAQQSISLLERAKDLSANAYSGPYSKARGDFTGAFGNERGQTTAELNNLVTADVLGGLKGTFGGNPTEGERKIALDVAGSSDLPHALRVKVYQRMIDAAQLRMQQNLDRANQIREGTYYRPGGGTSGQGAISASGGQSGAPALPPPSPSNRPGAVSPADRFGQLVGSGLTKAQAYQQLHSEGY